MRGVMCVNLNSCACLLCCCHSVDESLGAFVCVFKCLIVFAAVWLSIYQHILSPSPSYPLNDAQPRFFSLSLSIVLGCLVTA